MRHLPRYTDLSVMGVRVGLDRFKPLWALEWECKFFFGESIGIVETNTFQLNIFYLA